MQTGGQDPHPTPLENQQSGGPMVIRFVYWVYVFLRILVLLDFSLTVKVAPHECVIRTGQP